MENRNEHERIKWVDLAKGVAIILVILGHGSWNTTVDIFIYSFHMPLLNILAIRNREFGNLEIGVPVLGNRLFCA